MKGKTYRDLSKALLDLTDEQLNMTVTVSDGCDENGNAEFHFIDALCLAMDDELSLAIHVFKDIDDKQPFLMAGKVAEKYKTYRELRAALQELDGTQLDMEAMVAYGVLPFISVHVIDAMTLANGNDVAAAAEHLFAPNLPILLFQEDPPTSRQKLIKEITQQCLEYPERAPYAVLHLMSDMNLNSLTALSDWMQKLPQSS